MMPFALSEACSPMLRGAAGRRRAGLPGLRREGRAPYVATEPWFRDGRVRRLPGHRDGPGRPARWLARGNGGPGQRVPGRGVGGTGALSCI